jgi:O-antigen ligase
MWIMVLGLLICLVDVLDYGVVVTKRFRTQLGLAVWGWLSTHIVSALLIPQYSMVAAGQTMCIGMFVNILGHLGIVYCSARKRSPIASRYSTLMKMRYFKIRRVRFDISLKSIIAHATACCFAVWLMCGRWSPIDSDLSDHWAVFTQFRFWCVLATAFLWALCLYALRPVKASLAQRAIFRLSIGTLFAMGISALWSPNPDVFSSKFVEVVLVICMVWMLEAVRRRLGGNVLNKQIWNWIVFVGTLLALITVSSGLSPSRVNALGGGPNVFSRLMGLLATTTLERSLGGGVWYIGLFLLATFLVLASGSRGGLLGFLASVMVLLWAKRLRLRWLMAIIVVAWIVASLVISKTNFGASMADTVLNRIVVLTLEDRHTAGREVYYESAIELLVENPVAGVGIGGYSHRSGLSYPHNICLELLSEGGLIAFFPFCLYIALILTLAWRRRHTLNTETLASFVLLLTACQFSGDFYDSRGLFVLPLLMLSTEFSAGVQRKMQLKSPHASGASHGSPPAHNGELR